MWHDLLDFRRRLAFTLFRPRRRRILMHREQINIPSGAHLPRSLVKIL